MGGCISLKSDFKTVLEKIQFFFIISKLFDNNNSYALSTRNRKCANTCIILGEAHTYKDKNLNKIYLKNVQKALKWPLQCVDLQKVSGGACFRTPLEPFSFLNLHQILPEKICLIKISKFNALVLEKISEYAFDMKHFQRAYVI